MSPSKSQLHLEAAIRQPFDGLEDWGDESTEAPDMAHVVARGVVDLVKYELAFQARYCAMPEDKRITFVTKIADLIRGGQRILAERTTSLMSTTTVALKPEEQKRKLQFDTLAEALNRPSHMAQFAKVAQKHMTVDRLVRLVLSAASRNPKILECTPKSVLAFTLKCSETGLEPIGAGGCWPIPRWNGKIGASELNFSPDYRGLLNCARWSGCIKDGFASVVCANDHFTYTLGMNPTVDHKPPRGPRGELEGAYCVLVMPDDSRRFEYLERERIEQRRDSSTSWQSAVAKGTTAKEIWTKWPHEMWMKTVVIYALKMFAGNSSALAGAIGGDMDDGVELPAPSLQVGEIPNDEAESGNGQQEQTTAPPSVSPDDPLPIISEIRSLGVSNPKIASEKVIAAYVKQHGGKSLANLTAKQAADVLASLQADVANAGNEA